MLILLFIFYSCDSKNELEFHLKVEEYVENNFETYAHIHQKIEIWLNAGRRKRQVNLKSIVFDPNYKLDKLLAINEDGNKLVGTVNVSDSINKNNSTHDWIFMISGIKILGEWKFFRGGSLYVPRKNYKYDVNEPLNHFQLSVIGRDFFLKKFLLVEDRVTVNSDVLNDNASMKDSYRFTSSDSIKNWIDYVDDQNRKIISEKEFNDIQESIKNEVHQDIVLPKKGTKEWTELYGTKTPLFERKEWKNLIKK
jgi:uncharacterized protein Veg